MVVEVGATISSILGGIKLWRNHRTESQDIEEKRKEAINQVLSVATATKAYSYDVEVLDSISREEEKKLSKAWQIAGTAISEYDYKLYESSRVKSLGWADPREWHNSKNSSVIIELDAIIEQCEWLLAQEKKGV